MSKTITQINHKKILTTLYILLSAVSLSVFFFTSTPSLDEYIALNAMALWGTLVASVILLTLLVLTIADMLRK